MKTGSKSEQTASAVNLKLDLEDGRNPDVDVDYREKTVAPGTMITWHRQDKDHFEIKDFGPAGGSAAFQNMEIGPNGQWVKCTFQPQGNHSKGTAFEYTITVEDEAGTTHDTTHRDLEGGGPTSRRPVIRN